MPPPGRRMHVRPQFFQERTSSRDRLGIVSVLPVTRPESPIQLQHSGNAVLRDLTDLAPKRGALPRLADTVKVGS